MVNVLSDASPLPPPCESQDTSINVTIAIARMIAANFFIFSPFQFLFCFIESYCHAAIICII
jgi:hypothetical protein